MDLAGPHDVADLIALRAAVAKTLTARHGAGPWSRCSTERGVLHELKTSPVFVAREAGRLIASLRLTTKKPWAIDLRYFNPGRRPLYLHALAVTPELQGRGIGRRCIEEAVALARAWPADALRLDAYDAPAGAGPFYAKCGFRDVGHNTYRGCPLVYFERLL